MREQIDLGGGGVASVILARGFDISTEFRSNAQLQVREAESLPVAFDRMITEFPTNVKGIFIGGDLPQDLFAALKRVCDRRSITYIHRRNAPALEEALRQACPKKKPVEEGIGDPEVYAEEFEARRGRVSDFIKKHVDYSKSNAEEARRLLVLAHAEGLKTTFGSLTQGIAVQRRKSGGTGVPRSIMSAQAKALQVLDEAIAGLQLMREYVETTEAENVQLKQQIVNIKKSLGV